jgi:hypothetical protein
MHDGEENPDNSQRSFTHVSGAQRHLHTAEFVYAGCCFMGFMPLSAFGHERTV